MAQGEKSAIWQPRMLFFSKISFLKKHFTTFKHLSKHLKIFPQDGTAFYSLQDLCGPYQGPNIISFSLSSSQDFTAM